MTQNFPVDQQRGQFDSKIKSMRDNLNASITHLIETGCDCGSLESAIHIIDEEI